jgi:hypothetical protein
MHTLRDKIVGVFYCVFVRRFIRDEAADGTKYRSLVRVTLFHQAIACLQCQRTPEAIELHLSLAKANWQS